MNGLLFKILILLLFCLLVCQDCKKEPDIKPLPNVKITVDPPSGTTTDIFSVKISRKGALSPEGQLFYRWDWNNDSIWDTKFSSGSLVKHRYFKPGNQVIRISETGSV